MVTGAGVGDEAAEGVRAEWAATGTLGVAATADGATSKSNGSTVSPVTPRSRRTWGYGRRELVLPAAAPFLDSKLIVFTKRSYRTT